MEDLKQTAREIFTHALADCSIPHAFDRMVRVAPGPHGPQLFVDSESPIALDRLKRLRIVAAGKAAAPMLEALLARFPVPQTCDLGGVLIAPQRPATLPASIQFFPGGHPLPNEASFAGASAALALLREIADFSSEEALALFLISGGASAMMELPLSSVEKSDPSISLADTVVFHQALVHSGASIVEMNCIRKHFSAVKGGRLALAAGSARKLTFLVSDVPPTHLDALASGPTLPDTTTVADCREIIARCSLLEQFPPSVRRFFESSALPETPKPGELISPHLTLLDSSELARAAQSQAVALGFHAVIDNSCDDWPFDRAADYLLNRLRDLRRTHPRCCLISTGEVSVPVPQFNDSASHIGGRNQHLALYLAIQLRAATQFSEKDAPIAILTAGSDGIDGNSAAAGAVVNAHTLNDASPTSTRESALAALAAFDSSTWLAAQNATIFTGPTGQNLRDLRILLVEPHNGGASE